MGGGESFDHFRANSTSSLTERLGGNDKKKRGKTIRETCEVQDKKRWLGSLPGKLGGGTGVPRKKKKKRKKKNIKKKKPIPVMLTGVLVGGKSKKGGCGDQFEARTQKDREGEGGGGAKGWKV